MGDSKLEYMSPRMLACFPIIFLISLIPFLFPPPFQWLDGKLYDLKLQLLRSHEISQSIVHLDIDDMAIKEIGGWPWDRSVSAALVKKLTEYGAKVIVFDILYTSRGKSDEGNAAFFEAISRSGRVVSAMAFGISNASDANLVVQCERNKAVAIYEKAWSLEVPPSCSLFTASRLSDTHAPLAPLTTNSREIGHIKSTADSDGVHRRIPLLIKFEEKYIPSLSLAALAVYFNLKTNDIKVKESGEIELKGKRNINIPIDSNACMLLHWQRPWKSYPHYSVAELIGKDSDPIEAQRYKDKIIIIGVTSTGATDIGVTPLSNECPLSRIHSNALNTILTGHFITKKSATHFIILAIFLSIVFYFSAVRLNLSYAVIIAVSTCAIFLIYAGLAFWKAYQEVPTSAPLFVFILSATTVVASKAIYSESQAAKVSSAMEKYLSPQTLKWIVKEGKEIDLATKRKELTILFADIAGFSSISESLEVEYLEQFLNDFFESMTNAVFENKGTVNKFLGDGLLAFFGEPIELPNHALSAVAAAYAMIREMASLNKKWAETGIKQFEAGVHLRIGITTGVVVVGNIGSRKRMEYTVLGSAVNLASRLQSLASHDRIMVSSRTWSLIKDSAKFRNRETVRVRGFDKDVTVYELEPYEDSPSDGKENY